MPRVSPRKAIAAILGRQRREGGAVGGVSESYTTFTGTPFDVDTGGPTWTGTLTVKSDSDEAIPNAQAVTTISLQRVSTTNSVVTAAPTTITDDGVESSNITLTALDANGDPLPGIPAANCVLAVTGTGNTVTQPVAATDTNGQTTGSFVSTVAEAKTASYTVLGRAITDTAAVTVSGTPGDLHPNEPPGSVMFADADGSVEESGGDAMGITWLGAWTVDGSAPAGNLAVITDATNPVGSGEALRFIFEQALNPRCAQCTGTFPAEKSELYISLRIKFNDNFGPKMYYIGLPNVAGSADLYIDRGTDGRIRMVRQAISNLELIDSSEAAPKGNSSTPFTTGAWHHIEAVLVAETSPGAGDGEVTMWCDEVEIGAATAVSWGGNFGSLEWYGDINTVTDGYSYQLGELYLSGTDA